MSGGGQFILSMNDGKADKLLTATSFLNERIRTITCERAKKGEENTAPTLIDIERSHNLFVNASYKPYAALGYEYSKSASTSGTVGFGASVIYQVPLFGDFFSDMVLNLSLAAVGASTGTVPAFPAYIGTTDQSASSTAKVSSKQDTTAGKYTLYTHEYVDLSDSVVAVGAAATNFVRYCEYPGVRIIDNVRFVVNGNELDSYNTEAMLFYQKFKVNPNKLTGWKRLVGQEVPVNAYSNFIGIDGASNYGAPIVGLTGVDTAAVQASPLVASGWSRKLFQVVNGPQTPKLLQPKLDLWIPILLWFCLDARTSVPSVCIPYGQREIHVALATQDKLVFTAPGNLFLRLTVEVTESAGVNKGLATAVAVTKCSTFVSRTPVLASNSVIDANQRILDSKLYTNQIFVNPEIHDIYLNRIGFNLIRVHRTQTINSQLSQDRQRMSNLKWPVESLYVGVRPTFNVDAANPTQYRDWHQMCYVKSQQLDQTARSSSKINIDATQAWNNAATTHASTSQILSESLDVPTYVRSLDSLEIIAHGVSIYAKNDAAFFDSYLPWKYGESHLNAPEDIGYNLVNFCLFNGMYNPSGHLNLSRAREFDIQWFINAAGPGSNPVSVALIVVATCLNFLLVADGSAVIRFNV